MAQVSTYTVNHGFAHDGVFYGRDNEADIANIPSEVLADLVARGVVTEHKTASFNSQSTEA